MNDVCRKKALLRHRPPRCTSHAVDGGIGEAGIGHETLTLHVGAGTFLPVKPKTEAHKMHSEWGHIDAATAERLNAVRARAGASSRLAPPRSASSKCCKR
jgi:hypothetical protein